MKAADLFCGAGGAGRGISAAGFDVHGFDVAPQPRYPFEFTQADALTVDLSPFDFVWASPPCQAFCSFNKGLLQSQGRNKIHPELIEAVRQKLKRWGGPYIIENVPGSPLIDPVQLCGSSFGLEVRRHRLFESNHYLMTPGCAHGFQIRDKPSLHRLQGRSSVIGCYGHGRGLGDTVGRWRRAMGLHGTNLTRREIAQAIPPVYAEYLCRQVMRTIA